MFFNNLLERSRTTMTRDRRILFLGLFLACVGLLGFAQYLQHVENLWPCPLCVMQRMAYWLVGLTALAAVLHNPQQTGRRVYGGLTALFALAGAAVAAYQVWLIRHPAAADCRVSLEEKFLNALPLAKWWPGMFEANGDCALVEWKFLGLAVADWSLICFLTLVLLAVYLVTDKRGAEGGA